MDCWSAYEQLQDRPRDGLSDAEMALVCLGDLRQEVNSGGFDSYLRYWGANTAPQAVATCRSVSELGALAEVLVEALDRIGTYDPDPDVRFEAIDSRDVTFDDLDDRFYEIEADADLDSVMDRLAREAFPPS